MSSQQSTNAERVLRIVLRCIGTTSLLALIFVFAPRPWMESIHSGLGMGQLPEAPVVGYLARSTSAFYALLGGLFWVLSFHLQRCRPVLIYLGAAIVFLGLSLTWIDFHEGMPVFWKFWEGPVVIVLGVVISVMSRRLDSNFDR